MRLVLTIIVALLLGAPPVRGQAPGEVSFRILEHGTPVGDARATRTKTDTLRTAIGAIAARHWSLRLDDALPVTIELWEREGELLRVELPDGLAIVRSDLD